MALNILEEGNKRFVNNLKINRNLLEQANETSDGQHPFAVILSCIDSRTSAELIFDQGLGDIFSVRIAGNVINEDILGSMEFGCKLAGAKIIVVLGHTKCGAIKDACEMGNLTSLLAKIRPAVDQEQTVKENRNTFGKSHFRPILRKDNIYTSLFSPTRVKPVAGFTEFVKENADVAWHFIADSSEELQALADLKDGEGKLVKFHEKQLAIYKDDSGVVTALKPTCTHAGCTVQFNRAEKSWDCPCHGGRFDVSGKVLTGPPTKDLKAIVISDDL